jgi:hypothetical protein
MHNTPKVLGKWSLIFLLIGFLLVGVTFVFIFLKIHGPDNIAGWLSVPCFLSSIALFIGFLVSLINTSLRKKE